MVNTSPLPTRRLCPTWHGHTVLTSAGRVEIPEQRRMHPAHPQITPQGHVNDLKVLITATIKQRDPRGIGSSRVTVCIQANTYLPSHLFP